MTPEQTEEGRRLLEAARQSYRHVCILPGNPAEHSFVRDAEAFEKWARLNASDMLDTIDALRARVDELTRERGEARKAAAQANRKAQSNESAAIKFAKIEARIAEHGTRKPLPRIEAAFALAAANVALAASEARVKVLEKALRGVLDIIATQDIYSGIVPREFVRTRVSGITLGLDADDALAAATAALPESAPSGEES